MVTTVLTISVTGVGRPRPSSLAAYCSGSLVGLLDRNRTGSPAPAGPGPAARPGGLVAEVDGAVQVEQVGAVQPVGRGPAAPSGRAAPRRPRSRRGEQLVDQLGGGRSRRPGRGRYSGAGSSVPARRWPGTPRPSVPAPTAGRAAGRGQQLPQPRGRDELFLKAVAEPRPAVGEQLQPPSEPSRGRRAWPWSRPRRPRPGPGLCARPGPPPRPPWDRARPGAAHRRRGRRGRAPGAARRGGDGDRADLDPKVRQRRPPVVPQALHLPQVAELVLGPGGWPRRRACMASPDMTSPSTRRSSAPVAGGQGLGPPDRLGQRALQPAPRPGRPARRRARRRPASPAPAVTLPSRCRTSPTRSSRPGRRPGPRGRPRPRAAPGRSSSACSRPW